MEGFLNPNEVLKQLKIRKDMIAADFGSGSGGWAIPLAKKLEEGKIYAIDILEEPLSALRAKIKLGKILNIEVIKSDVEKTSRLMAESCDLVLMTNLLFQCQDKKSALEEGKRVLKPGGRILVVDWKIDTPMGPKEERVSPEEVKKIARELNLEVEKEFEAGLYHWGLILKK
jgi:ubiquinone/menaquinone biosynthesis C-methylase UbiE